MRISVTMITMNEEKNIERALSSCSFADEIVVVDGGSTDGTLDILKANNKVTLIQHPWGNHFGRQRQVSLEHCSGEWVIRLDADEAFSLKFEHFIRNLLSSTPDSVAGYKVRQCNLVGNEKHYSKIFDDFEAIPRIWRNTPDVRWERQIHETLTGIKGELKLCEVYVVHYGFLDKKRYWQKGKYYSQVPDSGFNKAEQLYFREYDIQPRPPESVVAEHVPEYVSESEMSTSGEVAIIGQCTNTLKGINFNKLSDTYNLTICLDEKTDIDNSHEECCFIKFPYDPEGSGKMIGLEFELIDKDIIFTEGIASPCTYQAILAKLKFGIKVITITTDASPVDNAVDNDTRAMKEIAGKYVDVFIVNSENTRDALLSDGVSNSKIVLMPVGEKIGEMVIENPASAMKYSNVIELIDHVYLSTFKGAISELAEFVHLTEKNTLKRIRSVYAQQLKEWRGAVGKDVTKSRVAAFYSDTDSYLFDLIQYNYESSTYMKWSQDLFNLLADLNKAQGHLDILDFGGGIGSQLINVSSLKGAALNYADIPGKTFEFAQWRFNRRMLNINMIDATKEDYLGNMLFDVVFAFDVLEHLVDPEKSVDYLIRHIKPDGFLVAITSFVDNDGDAGWHLNVDKYTDEGFYSVIKSLGMEMMNEGIPRVFRKDRELSVLLSELKTAEIENRLVDARTYMEQYLEMRPVDLQMLLRHADLCTRLHDREATQASLNKVRLFNPDMPEVRAIEELINKEKNEVTSC